MAKRSTYKFKRLRQLDDVLCGKALADPRTVRPANWHQVVKSSGANFESCESAIFVAEQAMTGGKIMASSIAPSIGDVSCVTMSGAYSSPIHLRLPQLFQGH